MKFICKYLRIITALFLVVSFAVPVCAAEAAQSVMPLASDYITSYNTYICDMGNGEFQIWFDVMGTSTMDELGTLSIMLYEVNRDGSLTWLKTFLPEDNPSMLRYNYYFHCSHVSFQGSSSKTYTAYVCIWAGKNGNGDTRYMWATE